MSILNRVLIISALFTLTACGTTYTEPATTSPAEYVSATVTDKIPGKFLLRVESDDLVRSARVLDMDCSAHRYVVDASASFKESSYQTLAQVVEDVEFHDGPVTGQVLSAKNALGLITVRPVELRPTVMWDPGFFSGTVDSEVQLSAVINVDTGKERVFTATAKTTRQAQVNSIMCTVGAKVVSKATSLAIRELMEQLAEKIGNSEELKKLAVNN